MPLLPSSAALRRTLPLAALLFSAALLPAAAPRPAQAAPTSLTYTGQLLSATSPPAAVANGLYDMQFQLFTAATGGTQVGPTVSLASVPVVSGVYSAQLSFGNVFTGQTLWLQVSYRPHGTGAYTLVTPRPLASNSAFADFATLSGSTQGLQTKAVSSAIPATGQVLTYNGTLWVPGSVGAGDLAVPLSLSSSALNGTLSVSNSATASGPYDAIQAYAAGSTASAVVGIHYGSGNGLYGQSGTGDAVLGVNTGSGDSGLIGGVEPISGNSQPVGVFGGDVTDAPVISVAHPGVDASGRRRPALQAAAPAPDADGNVPGVGVYGNSVHNTGVQGIGPVGVAGYGPNGGQGVNGGSSSGGDGVVGSSDTGDGVLGIATSSGIGVYGDGSGGAGVYGTSFSNDGVDGVTSDSGHSGVAGINNGGGTGVYGSSSGDAGYFVGNVVVTGTLTANTKHFRIDDPLDPANKYLVHASIESDEMTDLYSGNVTTDGRGVARVTLPHWFQALNGDYRYQLTCLGRFAQAIVAAKIRDNRFTIKTDHPNVEVSWQVTGVRRDASAGLHPMQVEEVKPEGERGLYLDPVAQGKPVSQGIGYARQTRQAKN